MGSIFAYSLLAGLAPLLSSSIPFFTLRNRNINASVFHILLCISVGLLFAVATLELVPESIDLSLRSLEEEQARVKLLKQQQQQIAHNKLMNINNNNNDNLLETDENNFIISDLQINKLINKVNDINQKDDTNTDIEDKNDIEEDEIDKHNHEEDDDDEHDHDAEERKHKLRTPLYGLGFGFAILIVVETIFSGLNGGTGHHSHSHGGVGDIISDEDEDDLHNKDSIELLNKNNKDNDDNNNSNGLNNSIRNDDIAIHNNIETSPDSTTPTHLDNSINSSSKNRNINSNKVEIKSSNSGNSSSGGGSKLTITTFIALSIHSFVDGVVIASAFSSSKAVGARVALAIVIHKIPDGLVLSSIILSQKKFSSISRNPLFSNPFFYFLLISCMTPLGAFISSFLFGGLSMSSGSFVLGFGAGTFLYITSTAILPEILSSQSVKKSTSLFTMFLGYLLFIFLDSTFHGAH